MAAVVACGGWRRAGGVCGWKHMQAHMSESEREKMYVSKPPNAVRNWSNGDSLTHIVHTALSFSLCVSTCNRKRDWQFNQFNSWPSSFSFPQKMFRHQSKLNRPQRLTTAPVTFHSFITIKSFLALQYYFTADSPSPFPLEGIPNVTCLWTSQGSASGAELTRPTYST